MIDLARRDYVKVIVANDQSEMWTWCSTVFGIGTWFKMFGINTTSATYYFEKPAEAMMFSLRWVK